MGWRLVVVLDAGTRLVANRGPQDPPGSTDWGRIMLGDMGNVYLFTSHEEGGFETSLQSS